MSTKAVVPAKPVTAKIRPPSLAPGLLLQRKCDCGSSVTSGSECEECKKKKLQRRAFGAAPKTAPPIVHEVLGSPGSALDRSTCLFFEQRLGHDFSKVRVHTDARASDSAHAVNALAYTVGRDVVFAGQAYSPKTEQGRSLIAHELVHVTQQRGLEKSSAHELPIDHSSSECEREAEQLGARSMSSGMKHHTATRRAVEPMLNRADPAAVGRVMGRGAVVGAGIQFWPTNVVDTQIGPVSGQGGLIGDQANRLSVIIGENLTPRGLARQLMPLWDTATPFTPPGGGAPVPNEIITEQDLARALLVFNQNYLPVPSLEKWRAGLRFPLPVEIDDATGMATVHPTLIHNLSGVFDAAWEPLLDHPAAATAAPAAAALNQEVTQFLAQEPSALGRGITLGARAITNAVASRPFILEVFRQLGADVFEVALAFMDNLVSRQTNLLASQRDGAAILAAIEVALNGRPAVLSATQQASFDRAQHMLALRGGIVARNAPGRACEPGHARQVTVQPIFFRNNAADPAPTGASFPNRMQVTQDVWAKLGVRFTTNASIMRNDGTHKSQGGTIAELNAIQSLRTGAGVEVFVVDNDIAILGGAATFMNPPGPASKTVLSDRGTSNTLLAHEMGHVLGLQHPGTGTPHDGDANTIMQPSDSHSVPNSTRNTAINERRMTWPAGAATCIMPDP